MVLWVFRAVRTGWNTHDTTCAASVALWWFPLGSGGVKAFRAVTFAAIGVLVAALSAGVATAEPARDIRVLSYNIHTGIGADGRLDLTRTARVITASGADIVGLQEVDVRWSARSGYADQAAELARLTGMHVFFAPIYDLAPEPGRTERRRYGVALLSRFPILRTENHSLTRLSTVNPNPTPRPAPGFGEAVLSAQGRVVHAYVTHLDYRADPGVRATQVGETLRILDGDPAGSRQVLTGDFNAEPGAGELAPLWRRLTDSWTKPDGFTYPAQAPVTRIDYVATAGGLRPLAARVLDTQASDHRPVLAELSPRGS